VRDCICLVDPGDRELKAKLAVEEGVAQLRPIVWLRK
jgi:hypothetical protein